MFFFCLVIALSVFDDDAVDVNSKTSTTILRAFRTGFVFFFWAKKFKRKTAKKMKLTKRKIVENIEDTKWKTVQHAQALVALGSVKFGSIRCSC